MVTSSMESRRVRVSLGRPHELLTTLGPLGRPPNVQQHPVPVDVAPHEPAQLTAPATSEGGEHDGRGQDRVLLRASLDSSAICSSVGNVGSRCSVAVSDAKGATERGTMPHL